MGAWRQAINNPLSLSIGSIDNASFIQFQSEESWKKNIQQNFPQFVGIISNSHPRQFRPGVWIFLHIRLDKWFRMEQHLFFKKAQLTVITLAKKSVALRHWPVGKYLYASFKRRPLTGLWKRRTAAQEKLRVLTRVLCTNVALFFPSFVRRLEGAQEGSPGALLHWSSIIYPGPLSVLKIRLIRVKRGRFIIIGNWQQLKTVRSR